MTRKAINFDLDTHRLEEWYPTPNWRNAYMDIRNYMQEHGFEHRQGSGYISKSDMCFQFPKLCQKNFIGYLYVPIK